MKVIIAGGRNITDLTLVNKAVVDSGFEIREVVCGCSSGVDTCGQIWANRHDTPCMTMPAHWQGEGKAAGPKRNKRMAAYADALILIWDGKSRGSASMKREALAKGLKIHEVIV